MCDPRQAAEGGDCAAWKPLSSSVISLHTLLQQRRLHPGTCWARRNYNCARVLAGQRQPGPVVDNAALRELLLQRDDIHAVLDVWEGEPQVDLTADLCTLASPHIAGYSLDGRQRGTAQIYQALCRLGVDEQVQLADLLPRRRWRKSSWMPAPTRPGPWPPCAAPCTTRAVTMPTSAAA